MGRAAIEFVMHRRHALPESAASDRIGAVDFVEMLDESGLRQDKFALRFP